MEEEPVYRNVNGSEKKNHKMLRGVRVRVVNTTLIVIGIVTAVIVLLSIRGMDSTYMKMHLTVEAYLECMQAATDLEEASFYLSEQVRSFAATGRVEYTERLFAELEPDGRLDSAVRKVGQHLEHSSDKQYLEAVTGALEERLSADYYALRMAAEAFGYDPSVLPGEIGLTELNAEDEKLSDDQKKDKALQLLFDADYCGYQKTINDSLTEWKQSLRGDLQRERTQNGEQVMKLLALQYFLIGLLVILIIAAVVSTATLVISPLKKSISRIREQEPMQLYGSYELQHLATTYNNMYEENKRNQDRLAYEASHDVLTGVYNRSVFEEFCIKNDRRDIALILADIDDFKKINDTYGHDTGDEVLKRTAAILSESFRSEDFICRVGGDEFAVIMMHANSSMKEPVRDKIRRANGQMQMLAKEGLPECSLSVGVAFGDRSDPEGTIYKDADTALYRSKKQGKNFCTFF